MSSITLDQDSSDADYAALLVGRTVTVVDRRKPDTVHKWVQRGRLVRVWEDPDLFHFTQAMGLAERAASRTSGRIAA